jgi:hypothetical protein
MTQDNASIQVVKVNPVLPAKELTMTVNERSMGSSRVKDNLIVSFALGGMNKKANPAQILAEKRKEMTESMNN